jgi:hypothetical protein
MNEYFKRNGKTSTLLLGINQSNEASRRLAMAWQLAIGNPVFTISILDEKYIFYHEFA